MFEWLFFLYAVKPIAKLVTSVQKVQMLEEKAGTEMTVSSCCSNCLSAAVSITAAAG